MLTLRVSLAGRLAAALNPRRLFAGLSLARFSLAPEFPLDDIGLTFEEVEHDLFDLFERRNA